MVYASVIAFERIPQGLYNLGDFPYPAAYESFQRSDEDEVRIRYLRGVPETLNATAEPGKINLSWEATEEGTTYHIYRQAEGFIWFYLDSTTETTFTDTTAEPHTNYRYAIKAPELEATRPEEPEYNFYNPAPVAPHWIEFLYTDGRTRSDRVFSEFCTAK